MDVFFLGMENDEEMDEWIINYTVIVDCLVAALFQGGFVNKAVLRSGLYVLTENCVYSMN